VRPAERRSTTSRADTGLSGSYSFAHYWTTNVGLPDRDYHPADSAAGLQGDGISETYLASPLNLPAGLGGTVSDYTQDTTYDQWGDVVQEEIGEDSDLAAINNSYDQHTLQLKTQLVDRSVDTPADEGPVGQLRRGGSSAAISVESMILPYT
jgi:hypothetical protein